jgi:hypothetical protein
MNFKYNGESLNIVKNFQYLGIKRKYTATSSVSRRRAAVLISTRPLYACDINSTKSFKKMANNTGDRFSPCSLAHAHIGLKDDTVILAESAAELQASLNAMYLYCQTWKLQVNIFKTKVVIFSRSRLLSHLRK